MHAMTDLGELRQYKSFAAIAAALPPGRRGRPVHPSTISRWRTYGVTSKSGTKIKLRALKLPSGWVSTMAWLEEFIDEVTRDRDGELMPSSMPRTPAHRRREIERANRELDAMGIGV
jgi:hypothetical protein